MLLNFFGRKQAGAHCKYNGLGDPFDGRADNDQAPQEGKHGVNISLKKYDAVRTAIIDYLGSENVMTFGELNKAVHQELEGKFDGSISRYITTVKLDLEARGTIERVGKNSTQQIRLVADA